MKGQIVIPRSKSKLGALEITSDDYSFIQSFVLKHTGIKLDDQKKELLQNRLGGVLRSRGLSTVNQYRNSVLRNASRADIQELTDCITTNYTYFYREPAHFRLLLERVLPEVTARAERRGKRELRMWCAAASTGEEPYTLMMIQMEHFQRTYPNWDAGLLATDISRQALGSALQGVYTPEQLIKLPDHLRRRYTRPAGRRKVEVLPALRHEVTFRRFNLMNPLYPFQHGFDVIFCRNVLIYFDQKTRTEVLKKLASVTRPGGYVFISQAETVEFPEQLFETVSGSVFRRRG
ncbi:MAG: CheR family methyltransferase [Myxococcota bacterium]